MCMEDIVIGRAKRSSTQQLDSSPAGGVTIAESPSRVAIAFASADGAQHQVFPKNCENGLAASYVCIASQPPLLFDIETYGDLVTSPWNVVGGLGGKGLLVVEVFLERFK